jgi:hypothetical protein
VPADVSLEGFSVHEHTHKFKRQMLAITRSVVPVYLSGCFCPEQWQKTGYILNRPALLQSTAMERKLVIAEDVACCSFFINEAEGKTYTHGCNIGWILMLQKPSSLISRPISKKLCKHMGLKAAKHVKDVWEFPRQHRTSGGIENVILQAAQNTAGREWAPVSHFHCDTMRYSHS